MQKPMRIVVNDHGVLTLPAYNAPSIYPVPLRRWSISCVPVLDAHSCGGSGTSFLRSRHSTPFLRTD